MLTSLTIQNVVLIKQLTLEFDHGFAALTGETGAGKSILLGSLGLALGQRADATLVRKNADEAQVIAEFFIPDVHPVFSYLKDQGLTIDTDDRQIILRRHLKPDGRSRAFINDQPVSIGLLRSAGDMLVEIHGQFDTHGLLDPATHLDILDAYAGLDLSKLQKKWQDWNNAEKAFHSAESDLEKARLEEEYLRLSYEDLKSLAPQIGEEAQLTQLKDRLKNKVRILEGMAQAYEVLSNDDFGALTNIGKALQAVESVQESEDEEMLRAISSLELAYSEVQDAIHLVQGISDDFDDDDMSLDDIEERLYALKDQARKHQVEPEDLPQILEELEQKINALENSTGHIEALEKKVEETRALYIEEAHRLSKKRKTSAHELEQFIAEELPPLKLENAKFIVSFQEKDNPENWTQKGIDQVEFLVQTNEGQDPGLLHKVASGGELSRFMLAIKVIMAEASVQPSFIFDEVDSGIGGATAAAVGDRLARLAEKRQILVVTHSPQVAATADLHFHVLKANNNGDTETSVVGLTNPDERRDEIARMLAGSEMTDEARAAASKLLKV